MRNVVLADRDTSDLNGSDWISAQEPCGENARKRQSTSTGRDRRTALARLEGGTAPSNGTPPMARSGGGIASAPTGSGIGLGIVGSLVTGAAVPATLTKAAGTIGVELTASSDH
jgi:hypothetical protein